ncbi:hypothetical protein GQ457_04G007350 [Hibiscus cannabinus]
MNTGDVNNTSSGSTKMVESGQVSKKTSQAMNLNATAVAMSHNEKPSKFTGQNFKTWQQKMSFYLTMLNLAKYLNEISPVVTIGDKEGEVDDRTAFSITQAWEQGDFLCRNYILNGLHDSFIGCMMCTKPQGLIRSRTQAEEFQLIIHGILPKE